MKPIVKRRGARLLNDYSDFKNNPSDPIESNRLSKQLQFLREKKLPVPLELQSALEIALGALHEKNPSPQRGRPSSVVSNSYLGMLIWYRYNFENNKFANTQKRDIGRYAKIAESINRYDIQSIRAALLDGKLNNIDITRNESNVKRLNALFKNNGFILGADIHNETQSETFCVCVLGLSVEEAATYKQILIDTWMEDFFKNQGQ